MILNNETLSMAEIPKVLADASVAEEEIKDINAFIKKFVKIKPEKAVEIKDKISKLNNIKVKDEHVAKIIDLLPEDAMDLNKIFVDVVLDEDETKKILEIIKEFK